MEHDLAELAVLILCDDSTSFEMDDCFVTEANTMKDVLCDVNSNKN